jgi:hypothetical protein
MDPNNGYDNRPDPEAAQQARDRQRRLAEADQDYPSLSRKPKEGPFVYWPPKGQFQKSATEHPPTSAQGNTPKTMLDSPAPAPDEYADVREKPWFRAATSEDYSTSSSSMPASELSMEHTVPVITEVHTYRFDESGIGWMAVRSFGQPVQR